MREWVNIAIHLHGLTLDAYRSMTLRERITLATELEKCLAPRN